MFAAEAQRLAWVNGTILGRAVVPEVWSNNATFSGGANPVEDVMFRERLIDRLMEQLVTSTGQHPWRGHVAAIVDAKATSLADAPIQHDVGVLVEHVACSQAVGRRTPPPSPQLRQMIRHRSQIRLSRNGCPWHHPSLSGIRPNRRGARPG